MTTNKKKRKTKINIHAKGQKKIQNQLNKEFCLLRKLKINFGIHFWLTTTENGG